MVENIDIPFDNLKLQDLAIKAKPDTFRQVKALFWALIIEVTMINSVHHMY